MLQTPRPAEEHKRQETPTMACGPGSPELSKSYMDMASKLFTFTFTFTSMCSAMLTRRHDQLAPLLPSPCTALWHDQTVRHDLTVGRGNTIDDGVFAWRWLATCWRCC